MESYNCMEVCSVVCFKKSMFGKFVWKDMWSLVLHKEINKSGLSVIKMCLVFNKTDIYHRGTFSDTIEPTDSGITSHLLKTIKHCCVFFIDHFRSDLGSLRGNWRTHRKSI